VSGGGGGRWTFRGTGTDWFTAEGLQINQYVRIEVDHYNLTLAAVNTAGEVFDTYEMSIPEDQRKPELRPTEPVALPAAAAAETETSSAATPGTTSP
jgi:hypothetical protein